MYLLEHGIFNLCTTINQNPISLIYNNHTIFFGAQNPQISSFGNIGNQSTIILTIQINFSSHFRR